MLASVYAPAGLAQRAASCVGGQRENNMSGLDWVAVTLIGFVLIIGFMAVARVPQGMNYTVERFGRYTRTLYPPVCVSFFPSLTRSARA